MNKIKLVHGASKVPRAKLQSTVDQAIADDIALMAEWSNNETQYVVNELLRFAIAQEEDFQKYKAHATTASSQAIGTSKPISTSSKSPDTGSKSESSLGTTATHA
jgi:hypothetical protein